MVANVGNLNVRVGADISGLTEGMERAQRSVKRGADSMSKSAKASAQVFVQAKRDADQLLGSIDPLYAAQVRYDRELAKAQQLMKAGAMTAGEMARVQAGLKAQLDGATRGMAGLAKSGGGARIGMQQLGFQLGDISQGLAMGTKASIIFAQQSGQVIQSLQLMGGGTNKFLQFLGGPWGIALSVGAVALTPLIGKLFDTGETIESLIQKLKDEAAQSEKNDQAHKAFEQTLEGVRAAVKKYENALKGLEDQGKSTAERTLDQARASLAHAKALRRQTIETINVARARNELYKGSLAGTDPRFKSEFTVAESRISALEGTLTDLDKTSDRLEKVIDIAASFVAVERGSEDAIAGIHRTYNGLVEAARKKALEEGKSFDFIKKQTQALREQERVAVKAAEAAKKTNGGLAKFTLGEAVSLVRSQFGANPTSHQLTKGEHAKNSYHYAGQAVDFVPRGGMASVTKDQVRAAFEAVGAKILELLGPGDKGHSDHFHVAFAKQRLGPDAIAAAKDKRAQELQREADRILKRDNDFEEARDRLNGQLLQAQNSLVRGVEAQAKIAEQRIFADERAYNAAQDHDVAEGKITQAQADELKARRHLVTVAELTAVYDDKNAQLAEARFRLEDQAQSLQIDELQFRDEMARTQAEHRSAQMAILDAVYAQKKFELEHEKQLAIRNGATQKEIDAIQAKIDEIGVQKNRDQQRAVNQTLNPLEAWAKTIPQTAAEITEALQGITAHGLDGIADAIGSIIDGSKSMAEAFGDAAKSIISDLIQMFTRMLMFQALQAAFPGMFGGSTAAANTPVGFQGIGPRAIGGPVTPGRTYRVGEQGPELIRVGSRGQVIPNSEIGGGIVINQHFAPNFAGNAATKQDLVMMGQITKAETMAAVRDARRRGR